MSMSRPFFIYTPDSQAGGGEPGINRYSRCYLVAEIEDDERKRLRLESTKHIVVDVSEAFRNLRLTGELGELMRLDSEIVRFDVLSPVRDQSDVIDYLGRLDAEELERERTKREAELTKANRELGDLQNELDRAAERFRRAEAALAELTEATP